MVAISLGLAGLVVWVVAVVLLGLWVRRVPTKETGERASRVSHSLFFLCLGAPVMVALVTPGLRQLDAVTGLQPLPYRTAAIVVGVILAVPGLYYFGGSNKALRALGSGANAFRLTQRVVGRDVYQQTRNPMSFGYYLLCLAIALLSGSTTLLIYVAAGIIPGHIFFLKFFEERELALRFGPSYEEYKRRVPFLFPRLGGNTGTPAAQG